jgi:6-phosphofructokinase
VRVGLLTRGGDCPGLNAVIRAIVRQGERTYGDELVGFLDAWEGVLERRTMPLTVESRRGTLPRRGTVLVDLVHEHGWGQMAVAGGSEIVPAPLDLMVGKSRPVDLALDRDFEAFFA